MPCRNLYSVKYCFSHLFLSPSKCGAFFYSTFHNSEICCGICTFRFNILRHSSSPSAQKLSLVKFIGLRRHITASAETSFFLSRYIHFVYLRMNSDQILSQFNVLQHISNTEQLNLTTSLSNTNAVICCQPGN